MRLEKMVPGTEAWKNMLNAPMPKPKLTQKSKEVLSKPRNNVRGSVRIGRSRYKTAADVERARKRVYSSH